MESALSGICKSSLKHPTKHPTYVNHVVNLFVTSQQLSLSETDSLYFIVIQSKLAVKLSKNVSNDEKASVTNVDAKISILQECLRVSSSS